MDISLNNVNRPILPPTAGAADGAAAPKKPSGDWTAREVGAAELARVAGEESVDEKALRRDDGLGRLVSTAFDPATAAAALPSLGI